MLGNGPPHCQSYIPMLGNGSPHCQSYIPLLGNGPQFGFAITHILWISTVLGICVHMDSISDEYTNEQSPSA